MLIEDGKGNGTKAEVRKTILQVSGNEALNANMNGDGYIVTVDEVTVDTADRIMVLLINQDAKGRDMVVTHFQMMAQDNSTACYEVNLGATFSATVANGTAVVPANLRSGSGNVAGGEYYVNDGAGDMTDRTGGYIAYIGPRQHKDYNASERGWVDGGWVVPHGQSWYLSPQVADTFRGCVQFYFRD